MTAGCFSFVGRLKKTHERLSSERRAASANRSMERTNPLESTNRTNIYGEHLRSLDDASVHAEDEPYPFDQDIANKIQEVITWFCYCLVARLERELTFGLNQLHSSDDTVAANAAKFLFEKVHTSNAQHALCKTQMSREGAIPALSSLLTLDRTERVLYYACSALSEIGFRDPRNCLNIVSTPGILKRIVALIHPTSGKSQENAARIINNCAAFCEQAIALIVRCPGMLRSLTALAVGNAPRAKHIAVGALNSLSCSEASRPFLVKSGLLSAMSCVLEEEGNDDAHDAMHARAAMAIANLTGRTEAFNSSLLFAPMPQRYRQSIQRVVSLLDVSIQQKQWAGIFFRPYSILYPLHQLSCNSANLPFLLDFGLLSRLRVFLVMWNHGPRPERALELAVKILCNFAGANRYQRLIREAGLVEGLVTLASEAEVPASVRQQAEEVVGTLSAGHVALMMGQHRRLGAASPLMALDEATAALIADMAFGRHGGGTPLPG